MIIAAREITALLQLLFYCQYYYYFAYSSWRGRHS